MILDTILDYAGDLLGFASEAGGGVIGTVAGGPIGGLIGSSAGGFIGDLIEEGINALFGEDEDTTRTKQAGLPATPGGLPSMPTAPSLPSAPTGGLQGPVYGTQAPVISGQAREYLQLALTGLKAFPYLSDVLQRRWNFAREQEETNPKSQKLWATLANQLPKSHREALEQFLVGFPAPVGLSKSASDVFLTLMIAESGYTPEQLCCTPSA